jgi:hypothetical protein
VPGQIFHLHHEQMKQQIAGRPSNHFLIPSDPCRLLLIKKRFSCIINPFASKTMFTFSHAKGLVTARVLFHKMWRLPEAVPAAICESRWCCMVQ